MKILLLLAFVYYANAQFGLGIYDFGTGQFPDFKFEFHRYTNLVLVRNDTACIIVESGNHADLSENIETKAGRQHFEKEVYEQIEAGMGETVSELSELRKTYHDVRAVFECFQHNVLKLQYPFV